MSSASLVLFMSQYRLTPTFHIIHSQRPFCALTIWPHLSECTSSISSTSLVRFISQYRWTQIHTSTKPSLCQAATVRLIL
jgi:hypothetical protein